jgi:indolepyruvate ferredoxin oxidoreductase, beta subunit
MGDTGAVAGMSSPPKTASQTGRREPLALLISALGGQGGGVLTNWIGHAARTQGLTVQATSTPGVSQRTGGTTYYLELAPPSEPDAMPPVLSLTPLPGRVDVMVCAELLEAARMLERGMITPTRTTVIASTHRVFTTLEKMHAADGRFDSARIVDALRTLARHTVLIDMEAVRARHGAAISAVLFGALAGSGALPLPRDACEGAIRAAGKGVDVSLAAFSDAYHQATRAGTEVLGGDQADAGYPAADTALPGVLVDRIATLPVGVGEFARLGALRAIAYQDLGYAQRYLGRIERIVRAEALACATGTAYEVAREAARHLALWMCYEDVIRVASLKGRASRLARIRGEVQARNGDVVRVYDLFNPSIHEIAAILPHAIGAWLERRAPATGRQGHRAKGVTLQASSVFGAIALRSAAALRPLRPYSRSPIAVGGGKVY